MAAVSGSQRASAVRPTLVVAALLSMIVLVWILATPRSAGPDEPGHNVRAGALVRGQLDGESLSATVFQRGFELPASVGFPDPACYAFHPFVPATCAADLEAPAGDAILGTRSADYPIWGHVLPGVGTLGTGEASAWIARIFDALIPVALLTASILLASRRRALGVGTVLLTVTPMAWFMFAVVNPSGLVIAGGIGLWTALVARPDSLGPDRLVAWLAATSWCALVLPRRDGLVWAALILSLGLLLVIDRPSTYWRRLGHGPQALILISTVATLAWASRSDTNAVRALFAAPLAPLAAFAGRAAWRRATSVGATARYLFVCATVALGAVGGFVIMHQRVAGFDRGVLRLVIGETGNDLTEVVGVLGWLDTPLPTTALYLWFIGLGLLVGAALMTNHRMILAGSAAILATAVLASWVLTMLQNDQSGTYWQGRYYLPLLAGVPILFSRLDVHDEAARRVGLAAAACSLVVSNMALAALMRRFGVGISGSLMPWEWDTYGAPIPPVALLATHVVVSIALFRWVSALSGTAFAESGTAGGVDDT